MKQKFSSLLLPTLIICVALLVSCSKDNASPLSGRTIDDMTFGPELSYKTVKFDGQDLSNITASSSEGWCQAYPKGSELLVNVIDNFTYSERTSNIVVLDNQTGDKLTFKAIQLQNDAILPDESIYEAPAEGGIVTITLQTNTSNNEIIPHADWIKVLTRTRALQPAEYQVSVAENNGSDTREGYVEFANKEAGVSTKVLIRQLANPYIKLDKDIVTIDETGGEIDINVTTNVDFLTEVERASQSWVQVGSKTEKGGNLYVQKLQVTPLPANVNSRRAIVYFVKSDLSVHAMLTIEQQKTTE